MFIRARPEGDSWCVANAFGHDLRLPRVPRDARVEIGVVGTRAPELKAPGRRRFGSKLGLLAAALRALDRPIYLLDTRRTGVGGQGSWSPLELATLLPDRMPAGCYAFLHLPCLAPSVGLLEAAPNHTLPDWRSFRDRYRAELTADALDVGQAFVEAAAAVGGLAVLLCAEQHRPDFEDLSPSEQDANYCHRFTLANALADRLARTRPDVTVTRRDVDQAVLLVS